MAKKSKKDNKELKEKEFVELEYVGRGKQGDIFDTNIKEKAKEMGLNMGNRPVAICLGQNMILPAIDEFLIGKSIGKEYKLELKPENAFGKRKKELVKTMPMRVFREHNINPRPGMAFNFDNRIGKIRAVSGGRVIVDFNNPMASKEVVYKLKPKRKIKDKQEKVKVLIKTLMGREIPFQIKDSKVVFEADEKTKQFIQLYKDQFKEILDMEIGIKGENNKQRKKKNSKKNIEEKDKKEENGDKKSKKSSK